MFAQGHSVLALLCLEPRPARFSGLGRMMSDGGGEWLSDSQVYRALQHLSLAGYVTPRPGSDRGSHYSLTREGRAISARLSTLLQVWEDSGPPAHVADAPSD